MADSCRTVKVETKGRDLEEESLPSCRGLMTSTLLPQGWAHAAPSQRTGPSKRSVVRWLWLMLACVTIAPLFSAVLENGASAAAAATVANVSITESGFSPAVVVVAIGTTVKWKNNGTGPHSLKGDVTSPALAVGAIYEHRFTTPGEYPYFDGTHTASTGTVVVTAGSASPPREHGPATSYL